MTNLVVNIQTGAKYDVYVGRGSPFGNRYTHKTLDDTIAEVQVESRQEAIRRFEEDLIADPLMMARVRLELRGKRLGCWCAPYPCHATVLAHYANLPLAEEPLPPCRVGCARCIKVFNVLGVVGYNNWRSWNHYVDPPAECP